MHEMQTIVTDNRGVCPSVSLSVTRLNLVVRAVCAVHLLQHLPNYSLVECLFGCWCQHS